MLKEQQDKIEVKCFFCEESNPIVLEKHHMVPRSLQEKFGISDESTVILCRNCHRKVHYVLRPIEYVLTGEILPQLENSDENAAKDLDCLKDEDTRNKILDKAWRIIFDLGTEMDFIIPKEFIIEKAKQENISETILQWVLLQFHKEGLIKQFLKDTKKR